MEPLPPVAPRTRLGRARLAVAAAVVVLATSVAVAPGAAQDGADPSADGPGGALVEAERIRERTLALAPDQPPSPDDVFVDAIEAAEVAEELALLRVQAAEVEADARADWVEAASAQTVAEEVVAEATARRDAARSELSTERGRLSDLTVRAYVTGGEVDLDQFRALTEGDTTDPAAGRALMFEQVLERQEDVTDAARTDSTKARRALAAAREELGDAEAEARLRSQLASRRTEDLAEAVAAHEAALRDRAMADARLRAGGGRGPVPLEVAIIGLPRLSADDLATWFASTPYAPRIFTPITDLARWFIEEGAAEGIRGDIAFAQAVLETGGFANEDSVTVNNFSGIGHCDSCPSGWAFPTPQAGVRAQIQLLKSYAVRQPDYVHELVDRRLRGPAGCCETWGDLTTVWATDPGYGPKVMLLYTSMVDHALARRAMGVGFEG